MPEKKSKSINLLPQEEFESSITGRVLRWAMTSFRFIVIVTELIVMGAFLSRFWLDARNSDLNDLLRIKTAQISIQKDFEKSFRDLQGRIKIVQELDKIALPSETVNKVLAKVPNEVSLQSISRQDDSIQIKGVSGSELSIAQFISNLKAESSFKEVALGQVGSSENTNALTLFTVGVKF